MARLRSIVVNEDNGECVCDECHGDGVIVIDKIELYQTCKKCNGERKFTWVEKVFGKDERYVNRDMINSIHLTMRKLQHYCYQEGYQITFDIKPVEPPNFNMNPFNFSIT
jgi:RecJ-like exonuclease